MSDHAPNDNVLGHEEEVTETGSKSGRKTRTPKPADTRFKLQLDLADDHPFTQFANELRKRGAKDYDLNDLLVIALGEVPAGWWQEKIEELTPLEYRINAALADPTMREKLTKLLVSQTSEADQMH